MEVRKGYKQTDIGILPSDWKICHLNDLVDSNRSIRYGIVQPGKFDLNGRFMVRGQDYSFGWVDTYQMFRVSPEVEERYKNARLNCGDIILTIVGAGTGKLEVVPYWLTGANITQTTARIAIEFEKADSNYCKYYFQSVAGKTQIGLYIKGAAQPGLNIRDVKIFKIPLPPTKSEQTAIATALSDADALITSLEKLIAKKHLIKQGAMQELLSPTGSDGKPKEWWSHKSLGEMGTINGAGVDKKINENELPVRLVNYMDVFKRDFIYSNELNHWVTSPFEKAQKCTIQKGDVFFTPSSEMRYDIAISAVAMEDIPDAAYSYHLVRFRIVEDWDLCFRTYIFKTRYFLNQAEQLCEGSGKRYVISLPKFRSMKIYYPPMKSEQTRIAAILSDMDAEIATLEAKLEKYRKIKLGMMQELLTGRIRLI